MRWIVDRAPPTGQPSEKPPSTGRTRPSRTRPASARSTRSTRDVRRQPLPLSPAPRRPGRGPSGSSPRSARPRARRALAARTAGRPADAHHGATGQAPQRGVRAVQTVAPSSIAAWFQSAARPGGTSALRRAVAEALGDAPRVRVDRRDLRAERERGDRGRRVRADARQRAQVGRPAVAGDRRRGRVERERAPVVPEAHPGGQDLGARRGRERRRRRPSLEPLQVPRHDPGDLGLLEHDLADEDRVGVGGPPPRQVAALLRVPAQQRVPQRVEVGAHPDALSTGFAGRAPRAATPWPRARAT